MRLHDISQPEQKYVAVFWYGGNGRILGPYPHTHLVPIERQIPTPLTDHIGRRYWHPYTLPQVPVTAALCGGFPTRARLPLTSNYYNRPRDETVCARCRALAGGNWASLTELNNTDPFFQIPFDERWNATDPVTGL